MRDIQPEIEAAGASLIIVGNGTPAMAEAFVEQYGEGVRVYTDPERRVYRALGAKRASLFFFLDPRYWLHVLRAFREGHRKFMARPKGDAAQLGGVWIARAGGEVVWMQRSKVAGDHPDPAQVAEGLREL